MVWTGYSRLCLCFIETIIGFLSENIENEWDLVDAGGCVAFESKVVVRRTIFICVMLAGL
jgi:hypothetical protein